MQYSLFKWNGLTPLTDFVGLAELRHGVRKQAVFMTAIGNNVLIVVLSLVIQIPFALALAVLLARRFRGRAIFRLLFFLPYVLSEAITGDRLQPDAPAGSVVDCVAERRRPRGLRPGLARATRRS